MQLFTTAEAAAYLRLKERKIYEMVAEGTVPCTKVTGRWLFPKAELDQWLAASVARPAGMARPEPAPIVAGSHDPLLEWALRESGSGLATLAVGSEAGLRASSPARRSPPPCICMRSTIWKRTPMSPQWPPAATCRMRC